MWLTTGIGVDTTDAGDGDVSSYLLSAFINGQRRQWEDHWNNHEWLNQHKEDPLLGGLYKRRYQELYDAERKREINDFKSNTGTSGSQYWTHDYQGNPGYYSSSGYMFEVSEAIMALYGMNRRI